MKNKPTFNWKELQEEEIRKFDELLPPFDEESYRAMHKVFGGEPGTARKMLMIEQNIQHKKAKRELLKSHLLSTSKLSALAVIGEIREKMPKELEMWKPKPFPVGKEGILDAETVPIAIENAKNMRDNRYETGFNDCLSTLTKLLEELEAQIK